MITRVPFRCSRRRLISLSLLACAVLSGGSVATVMVAAAPVNADRGNVAVHGYDVVAYHTDGRPVPGSAEFTFSWKGATWRFASARSRDLFAASPERYAPQFGGYCAWAVSRGYTADIDPQAWAIVDGRLYLNYSKRVQGKWSEDRARNISLGHANWPRILAQ